MQDHAIWGKEDDSLEFGTKLFLEKKILEYFQKYPPIKLVFHRSLYYYYYYYYYYFISKPQLISLVLAVRLKSQSSIMVFKTII